MSKTIKEHVIWTDIDLDIDDWRDEYINNLDINDIEVPDEIDDNDVYDFMNETISMYLDDERANLDIDLPRKIIVIADLGLWNGRKSGYKEIGNNISNCLTAQGDNTKWYLNSVGDLCCEDYHHDGVNYYTYRMYKDTATETQIDNLKNKLYNGTATRADITRVTARLGGYIAKVYGLKIRKIKGN